MTDVTPIAGPARARFLGWRAERRPRPGFAHVLGAVAGAFAVIAMVAFVAAADNEDPQLPGVVLSLVLIAIALAVGAWGSGPLRSAGATALVLTVPTLWAFAFAGDGGGGRGAVRGVLILTVVTYGALYLVGWTKGRGVFLAGALVALISWVAFEVAGDGNTGPFSGSVSTNGAIQSAPSVNDNSTATFAAIMVLGIVFLVVGGLLDRQRLAGTATPLLAVGSVAAIVGGVALAGTESALAGGVVAVLIGAAVGITGAAGRERRGTTWFGVLVVFGGLVTILVDIAPDEEAGVGAIALAFAVVCGGLAWWLAGVFGEPDDGEDRPLPPTAPVGGTSGRDLATPGEAAA